MKGCGFHQSDAAHHLHWGLYGLGSGFKVWCCSSLCVLSLRLKLAWKVDPCFIREGTGKGKSGLQGDWIGIGQGGHVVCARWQWSSG